MSKQQNKPSEYKTFELPPMATKVIDENQGIVEHIITVFGVPDQGNPPDVSHPGSFVKTIAERGLKVLVLDHHRAESVLNVVGKPLSIREIGRDELPPEVLDKYPEATGGLKATTQFFVDTPEGKGVFLRIKNDGVREWSYGYDALDKEYDADFLWRGKKITVRHLKTNKLWEYSPVLWGMAESYTISAKSDAEPSEGKPWAVFMNDDRHCVYKVDENGERTGDSLGCHDTEDEAMAQIRALHANEDEGKEMTMHGPVQRLGDVLQGSIHQTFTMMTDSWYISGMLDRDERILLSSLIGDALDILSNGIPTEIALREINHYGMMSANPNGERKAGRVLAARNAERIMNAMRLLHEAMADAGLMEPMEDDEEDKSDPAPGVQAADNSQPNKKQAGPFSRTPTSEEMLKLIEIEESELTLLEVKT